ncbi:Polysaccharide pyruvyl transferase [compost metagenome]
MEYLRRFDFVVGARIHGVMLAIQAGVPGLCIAHDSRIRELCEKCKIPFVMADDVKNGITIADLPHLVEFDGKAFDQNRELIAEQYRTFFQNNGLAIR